MKLKLFVRGLVAVLAFFVISTTLIQSVNAEAIVVPPPESVYIMYPSKPLTPKVNITVSWLAPSNPGVAGYNIYRNGQPIGIVSTSVKDSWMSYIDYVNTGTQYNYSVQSYDASNNLSLAVPTYAVTIPNPTVPYINLFAVYSGKQVTLTWSQTLGSGSVTGYRLYRNSSVNPSYIPVSTGLPVSTGKTDFVTVPDIGTILTGTSYTDIVPAAGTYSYYVTAFVGSPGKNAFESNYRVSAESARVSVTVGGRHEGKSADLPSSLTIDPNTGSLKVSVVSVGGGRQGHGIVTGAAGLNCDGVCNASFPLGSPITLTATPDEGSKFLGWSGDACFGSRATSCTFYPAPFAIMTAWYYSTDSRQWSPWEGTFALSPAPLQHINPDTGRVDITLSWSVPNHPASRTYDIYRQIYGGSSWQLIGSSANLTYTDSVLNSVNHYIYVVRYTNDPIRYATWTGSSNEVEVKILAASNTLSTPATAQLFASPLSVLAGQSSTLTWSSTGATSCTASGGSNGWAGAKVNSGTLTVAPTVSTSYSITCNGIGGTSAPANVTIAVTAVNPGLTKVSGGWSDWSTKITQCGYSGIQTRTCTNPYPANEGANCNSLDGGSPSKNYTNAACSATAQLFASPTSLSAGQSSTLTWSSTGATSCTASGGWSGNRDISGTLIVKPAVSTSYSITCNGTGGTSAPANVTIAVTAVNPDSGTTPIITSVSPPYGHYGDPVTITGTGFNPNRDLANAAIGNILMWTDSGNNDWGIWGVQSNGTTITTRVPGDVSNHLLSGSGYITVKTCIAVDKCPAAESNKFPFTITSANVSQSNVIPANKQSFLAAVLQAIKNLFGN